MLYSIDSKKSITDIPHKSDFDIWRSRLTDVEYQAIKDEIGSRIGEEEIATSSWIPGSDWTGTVFLPIYKKACRHDQDAAARFFGIIVWHVLMEHEKTWAFGRYEKDGTPIQGMTYFQINPSRI